MAKKDLNFKGKTEEDLRKMDINEFMKLIPSRSRRSLKRGFTDQQKKLLLKVKKANEGKLKKPIKTHCRDMVIIPEMLGSSLMIYTGKEWTPIIVNYEMLGRYLGEFTMNRKKVAHSAQGIGATRSSASMSVK